MNIPLSNRLRACCSFVHPGDRVADIGCDHGYLGIYLLTKGIATQVYAADINPQPLESAARNCRKFGVADKMQLFLSDGANNIPRDFDVLACAGMGADTMISILEDAKWLQSSQYRLILQCQSRRPELRRYLYENGFSILSETLAEDGKFIYPVMEVTYRPGQFLTDAQYHISPQLLNSGSPLLPAFYERVVSGIETTVQGLSKSGGEKLEVYQSILAELKTMEVQINGNCT